VRTSGESRLSEFLTWQAAAPCAPMLAFVPVLWPDFGLWDFLCILMRYHLRQVRTARPVAVKSALDPQIAAVLAERRAAFWASVSAST
jgi:ditrans,polycis-polyprenyl diphosphate synthase